MNVHVEGSALSIDVNNLFNIQAGIAYATALCEKLAKENCPVDTGNLRASISTRMTGTQGIVYTNVDYAPYVEYGTRFQAAQPFMSKAVVMAKPLILAKFGGKK